MAFPSVIVSLLDSYALRRTWFDCIKQGNRDQLQQYLNTYGKSWVFWTPSSCAFASECGQLSILQWLRHWHCPWDKTTCDAAASGGHLYILQWARSNGLKWTKNTYSAAARNGHLHILQWLAQSDGILSYDTYEDSCKYAAENNQVHILQWIQSKLPCYPRFFSACEYAAKGNHLSMLQWLRTQSPMYPWDEQVCVHAASNGNIEMLQWAVTNGCPWDDQVCDAAIEYNQFEAFKWLRTQHPPCPLAKDSVCTANLIIYQWIVQHDHDYLNNNSKIPLFCPFKITLEFYHASCWWLAYYFSKESKESKDAKYLLQLWIDAINKGLDYVVSCPDLEQLIKKYI